MSEEDKDIEKLKKKLEKVQLEKQILQEEQALERLKKEASGDPLRISPEFQTDHDYIADEPIDQTEKLFQEFNDTIDSNTPNHQLHNKASFEDVLQKIKKIRAKLFTFKGRTGRADYNCAWGVVVVSFLIWFFLTDKGIFDGLASILGMIILLFILSFHFSVTARRFHDLNKSAFLIIPIYLWVFLFMVFFNAVIRSDGYILRYGYFSDDTITTLRVLLVMLMIVYVPVQIFLCCFPSKDFLNEENKYGFKESLFGFDFSKPASPLVRVTPTINNRHPNVKPKK